MDKMDATAEVEYRIAKWLIINLEHQGFLSPQESAAIIKVLLEQNNPPSTCLETVVLPDE